MKWVCNQRVDTVDKVSYEAIRAGSSESEVADFITDNKVWSVVDPYEEIVDDLYEYSYPGSLEDHQARARFTEESHQDKAGYGEWFYFPWSGNVVRYPEEDDFYNLRTSRNRNLVTHEEQQILRHTKIATFGLSVGSNIIDSLVQYGVGEEYLLADFDKLGPTNLNRIRATMAQVGLAKTVVVGRKISEANPYARQTHIPDGYGPAAVPVVAEFLPDVIIEEMDDLGSKLGVRLEAAKLGVPVVMAGDIGERTIIDIERYDQDATTRPFHGRLDSRVQSTLAAGGEVSQRDKEKSLVRINGIRNLSPRLIDSAMDIGYDLGGMPQLGTTATNGGALAATAIQEILLGRRMETGSYVMNSRKVLGGQSPSSLADKLSIARRYKNRTKEA